MILISVLCQNASTSRILEPSPQGLISSDTKVYVSLKTLELIDLKKNLTNFVAKIKIIIKGIGSKGRIKLQQRK